MARCRPLQPGEYPPCPPQGVEPCSGAISASADSALSEYWESPVTGAGGRAGMAGGRDGRAHLPLPRPQPSFILSRGLSLVSFLSVGAGLQSPCTVGCGFQQLPPPAPSGASWAVPAKASPLPWDLVARSTGNGGHSGTEGLPGGSWRGGEWVVIVGKGSDQMPPGVPRGQRPRVLSRLIGCWTGPRPPALAPQRWGGGRQTASLCFLQTARPSTPDLFPPSSRPRPFPGPLQPQTASAGIESLP